MEKPRPRLGRAAMSADDNRRMVSRLFALIVWALVAGSAVFWGLRLFAQSAPVEARPVAVHDLAGVQGDLSRLLGSAPVTASADADTAPVPEVSARFQLTGIMAPKRPSEQGLAVIAVDGNPPRVYRVGAWIDGDWMLREVTLRTATVASATKGNEAGAAFVLEMPLVTAAATGVLPPTGFVMPPQGLPAPGRVPSGVLAR